MTPQPRPTPQLRLFVSPEELREVPTGPSPKWTLGEFFERYVVPVCYPRCSDPHEEMGREKTRDDHRTTIEYWRQFTNDPPLETISVTDCAAFQGSLATVAGRRGTYMSPSTQRKHADNLRRILRRAGMRGFDRQADDFNAGLIEMPPPVRRPRIAETKEKRFFSREELLAIWAATEQMKLPRVAGVETPVWWRVTVRTFYELGTRMEEQFDVEWDHLEQKNGQWYLVIPGKLRKGRRKRLICCVTPELVELWRSIRRGKSKRILRIDHCKRYRFELLQNLLRAAGLQRPKGEPQIPDSGWHALRRTHANSIDPHLAQLTLGHSSLTTTLAHYQSSYTTAQKRQQQLDPFWEPEVPPPTSEAG